MATNIKFDINHNPEKPTFILAKKSGERLGKIVVTEEKITQSMKDAPNLSCTMNKYLNGQLNNLWDEVKDFRLIWWREENLLFEITVEIDEADETIKSISGVGLAQAELSQINVYGTHINNEDDPNWAEAKSDADREELSSVLYNYSNRKLSILHRILERAPHYSIKHVDVALANIQRTFDFDGESIYDALEEIAEEIECLIVVKAEYNNSNTLSRNIYVYDLKNSCMDCNARFDTYIDVCPKCGSHSIRNGYGNDTTIFVTSDELGEKIGYSTDTDKVKNCFKLEAGDDDMTAAVRNCNPNGSDYIWHLSSLMREDMSNALKANLMGYDQLYQRYQTTQPIYLDPSLVDKYNEVIEKYSVYNNELKQIPSSMITYSENFSVTTTTSRFRFSPNGYDYSSGDYYNVYVNGAEVDHMIEIIGDEYSNRVYITLINSVGGGSSPDIVEITCTKIEPLIGYPALMETYYNVMDAGYYIQYSMMPTIEHVTKTAEQQKSLLTTANLSPIGVNVNLSSVTQAIADSNALDMAKAVCDSSRFKITINNSSYNSSTHIWTGSFKIENYSSNNDIATSDTVSITFSGDYDTFLRTKIDKVLNKESPDDYSITGLYKMTLADFKNALKLYGLEPLKNIYECGSKACEILQEQGVATPSAGTTYTEIYLPYYNKVQAVADEIGDTGEREEDLYTVIGKYDENNNIVQDGMQTSIESKIQSIHDILEFKKHFGNNQWAEFCSFIRDDKYTNSNYISSGLKSNAKIFENALKFLEVANQELYKSAELQHSITSTLKNLIYTEKFEPLLDHFEIGNWLRVKVDDNIYKLRLIEYDIDYDNFENISVKFSDVTKVKDGITDVQDILKNASSMASSYGSVKRQAEKGNDTNKFVDTWFEDGLDITNTKIIGGADNQSQTWDDHGMLFRRYDSVTDSYDDTQMKIINSTLAITTDNWQTVKTAVGQFYYVDPADGVTKSGYGINGEVLIGKLILGQQIGIYNSGNTLKFDGNGLSVENSTNKVLIDPSNNQLFKIQKNTSSTSVPSWQNLIWMNESGDANFEGYITANKGGSVGGWTITPTSLKGEHDSKGTGFQIPSSGTWAIAVAYDTTTPASGWGTAPFRVKHNGEMWATDAHITGAIIAKSGNIGGFNISNNFQIVYQDAVTTGTASTQYQVYMRANAAGGDTPTPATGSTHAFGVQHRSYNGSTYDSWTDDFIVKHDGSMKATKANITSTGSKNRVLIDPDNASVFRIQKNTAAAGNSASWSNVVWMDSDGNANFTGNIKAGSIDANTTITGSTITGAAGEFTQSFKVNVGYQYGSESCKGSFEVKNNNGIVMMTYPTAGGNPLGRISIHDTVDITGESDISIISNQDVSIEGNKLSLFGTNGIVVESNMNVEGNLKLYSGSAYYDAVHTGYKTTQRKEITSGSSGVSISGGDYNTFTISIPSISGYTFAGIETIEVNGSGSTNCVVGEFHTANSMSDIVIRVNNVGSSSASIIVKATLIYFRSGMYQYVSA